MDEKLELLRETMEQALREAGDLDALEALRVRMLGRKGEITQLLKNLAALAPEERKHFGQLMNGLRQRMEEGLLEARSFLLSRDREQHLREETLDVTRPGVRRALGYRHPLSAVTERMTDFFISLGFTVAEGPHIES